MADLLALLPNLNVRTYIVAPEKRRESVFAEITRPAFNYPESDRRLHEVCKYIPYPAIETLAEEKNLKRLKEFVIDDYAEDAEENI